MTAHSLLESFTAKISMTANAAQGPTKVIFRFCTVNDRYLEFGSANDRYRATTFNIGTWSLAVTAMREIDAIFQRSPGIDYYWIDTDINSVMTHDLFY